MGRGIGSTGNVHVDVQLLFLRFDYKWNRRNCLHERVRYNRVQGH